jgi:hypothetical protein
MPGEALREVDVFRLRVQVGARRGPQHVERHPPLESGPFLPHAKPVPNLAQREPLPEPTDEQRRVGLEALARAHLPGPQLVELRAQPLGHELILTAARSVRALRR